MSLRKSTSRLFAAEWQYQKTESTIVFLLWRAHWLSFEDVKQVDDVFATNRAHTRSLHDFLATREDFYTSKQTNR